MKKIYHYTGCGLDYVYLKNGFKLHKTAYGDGVAVENALGLFAAILKVICEFKPYLHGQDVRFMRKELDVSQAGLAQMLGVDSQTVARWEKDQCGMPVPTQRLLKLLCMEKLDKSSAIHSFINRLSALEAMDSRLVFEEKNAQWKRAA